MSFLNALASDGLSVGLRFYNSRINGATQAPAFEPEAEVQSCPAEKIAAKTEADKTRPAPLPLSPEEAAAGRAAANNMLNAEGLVGRLTAKTQTAAPDENSSPKQAAPENEEKDAAGKPGGLDNLSEEEKQQVQEMKQRDQEVRTHEQAHVAASAGLAGAPVYEYQSGPDGRRYAVGGHVNLRTSGSSDPEKALREAEAVKRAANAPADPSGTDRAAAARAASEINRLKSEKAGQDLEGKPGEAEDGRAPGRANGQEAAPEVRNGDSFDRKVLGAYAAAKFGPAAASVRPVLAKV